MKQCLHKFHFITSASELPEPHKTSLASNHSFFIFYHFSTGSLVRLGTDKIAKLCNLLFIFEFDQNFETSGLSLSFHFLPQVQTFFILDLYGNILPKCSTCFGKNSPNLRFQLLTDLNYLEFFYNLSDEVQRPKTYFAVTYEV